MTQYSLLAPFKHLSQRVRQLSAWSWGAIVLLCTILAASPSSSYAQSELPELGNRTSGLVSTDKEYELGRAWLRSLRSQVPTLEDPLILDYIRDLAYRLAPNSQLEDSRLEFVIVDSNSLNAFAVPGGIIGINGGLFLHAQTEGQFASVIAHELAHLSQRHFARRLERNQRNQPLAMAGLLASLIVAAAAGGDAGMAALATSQAYNLQQQLNYSRENEQEADRIGIATLAASGIDPRAMPAMFESMMRSNRFGQHVPEYLRTHPLSQSRVSDARNRAEQYPPRAYREDVEYYFMKSRVMLHYADSSEAARTIFKSLMESGENQSTRGARYGYVLASIKSGKLEDAERELNSLLKLYPNRISILILQAELLDAQGKQEESLALLAKHYERNPGNNPLGQTYATSLIKAGQDPQAERILQTLTQESPNNPYLWRTLSEVQGRLGNIVAVHQAQAEYLFLTNDIEAALNQLQQALRKSPDSFQQNALIQKRLDDFFRAREGFKF